MIGTLPSSVYASWQNRLSKEYGWPNSKTLPFTLALACIQRLLDQVESDRLEFSIDTSYPTGVVRWTVWFDLLPNPQPDLKEKSVTLQWSQSFEKMWNELLHCSAEKTLEILGQVMMDHLPQDILERGTFDFPGIRMSWAQENLTANHLLTHILKTTTEGTSSSESAH
jgi:hypothetical protein